VLNQLENITAKIMTNVDRGKAELGRAEANSPQNRERTRV